MFSVCPAAPSYASAARAGIARVARSIGFGPKAAASKRSHFVWIASAASFVMLGLAGLGSTTLYTPQLLVRPAPSVDARYDHVVQLMPALSHCSMPYFQASCTP